MAGAARNCQAPRLLASPLAFGMVLFGYTMAGVPVQIGVFPVTKMVTIDDRARHRVRGCASGKKVDHAIETGTRSDHAVGRDINGM